MIAPPRDSAVFEYIQLRQPWIPTDHEMVKTARHLIAGLLTDAKAHSRIRNDLTTTDLSVAMFSRRGVIEPRCPKHRTPGGYLDSAESDVKARTSDTPKQIRFADSPGSTIPPLPTKWHYAGRDTESGAASPLL
jgi:hypothetical protein